jgi:glycosidase
MDAAQFARRTQELLTIYPQEFAYAQLNLLDSHDMPRFLSLVSEDTQRLYLAYLFMMTYPGAPCIYYGDEIGLTGGVDPMCRKAFPWDESAWNTNLRDKIRDLTLLRHAMPVLRTGAYLPLLSRGSLLVYARRDSEDVVIVAINLDNSPQTISVRVDGLLTDDTLLQDQISDKQAEVKAGEIRDLTIPRMGAVILALAFKRNNSTRGVI